MYLPNLYCCFLGLSFNQKIPKHKEEEERGGEENEGEFNIVIRSKYYV